jgi:hypothetical protein
MKSRTRFEKLARGCFALTLTLAEWLELEQILSSSRKARRMFWHRVQRRSARWQRRVTASSATKTLWLSEAGNWMTPARP